MVKWSRHNLALVVLRILVWAKHLTSALRTEFQLVQGVSNACLLHHQAGEAACQDSLQCTVSVNDKMTNSCAASTQYLHVLQLKLWQ